MFLSLMSSSADAVTVFVILSVFAATVANTSCKSLAETSEDATLPNSLKIAALGERTTS